MRIEITEVLDGGLVRFGSPLGTACARWRGIEPPPTGPVDVELEIPDEVRAWAAVPPGEPALSGAGEQILMTAPVAANDGGVVTLRLGGSVVQAELAAPAVRPGARLRLTVERLELYPLNL
ncbi:hypothetical protein ACIRSS_27890 [Amycolatopsis sp. NPDC101161]|uniref:hypothetical protein n=1 Tax=Amycolatopsis sp. NPDC101161 TaxID=3363940 RepID=UPI003823F454